MKKLTEVDIYVLMTRIRKEVYKVDEHDNTPRGDYCDMVGWTFVKWFLKLATL